MKKVFFYFLTLAVFFSFSAFSQKTAQIEFDTLNHNFGKIKEEGGDAICTFYFTNTGNDTLKLLNVKPGCGCTSADWTKTPVLPGGRGYIKAGYNPKGRVGPFNKSIMVTSNAAEKPNVTLIISGEVLAKPKTTIDYYPVNSGNLHFNTNHISFGDTKSTEIKADSLKLYNTWNKPITMSFNSIPAFVKIQPELLTIEPGKETYFLFTYNASKKNDVGLVYDYIIMSTNDSIEQEKKITVSANIIEDFSQLTPKQLKKAPKIVFDTLVFNFDTVTAGEIVKCSFPFINAGKSNLIIRKTKASSACTVTTLDKTIVKKDGKGKIDIEFNTSGKRNDQAKTTTVLTNDPRNSKIILTVKGYVQEQKE